MHGTEAIIPLGDGNRLTIDQSALVEVIAELRAEVAELRKDQQKQHHETSRYARDTADTLKKIDTIGLTARETA
jgi:hypothetical protein